LEDYAETDPNVVRLSMWSVARDNGDGAGASYASPFNSGIAQELYDFAEIFGELDLVGASTTAALPSGSGASTASVASLGQYAAGSFASPMSETTGTVQTSALGGSEQTLVPPQPA
jgi:hypothetical protein